MHLKNSQKNKLIDFMHFMADARLWTFWGMCWLVCASSASGQDPDSLFNQQVEKFKNHIALTAHVTRINLDSRLSNSFNRRHIDYKTATSTRLGFSFDYRWLAFELFTRLPVEESDKKGSTQNSGVYGRINKSRFWANLIYQRFRGFYWSNPSQVAATMLPKGYFPIRPDIRNTMIQTSANYIFSPQKFSNPASQGENEWQTKSGGSFLAGFGYYGNVFRGDSSLFLIPNKMHFRTSTRRFESTPGC